MRCGAKCFLVQMELEGEKEIKSVHARSPVEARKAIRGKYGKEANILTVREKKRNIK